MSYEIIIDVKFGTKLNNPRTSRNNYFYVFTKIIYGYS